jgi:hypothetical protein
MKWFRRHLKQGARLALFALAVQFALSFGHFHGLAAQAATAFKSSVALGDIADTGSDATARQAAQQHSPTDHDPDQQSGDNCAICAVMAMANAVLLSPPPLLLLPQALEFLYRATDAEFVHLKSVGDAFQPRAPPAS